MKSERALQQKELDLLDIQLMDLNKQRRSRNQVLIVWSLLALIIGTVASFYISPRLTTLVIAAVAIYIGLAVKEAVKGNANEKRKRKSIEYLRNKNLVMAVEVNSDTFCLLEEDDDEGVYYLFQLPDNKVLSFGGQDFYEDESFPSDTFEIVEGRGINNEILFQKTFAHGKKIMPAKIVRGKAKWDLLESSSYPNPEHFTIADGRIEDFIK